MSVRLNYQQQRALNTVIQAQGVIIVRPPPLSGVRTLASYTRKYELPVSKYVRIFEIG